MSSRSIRGISEVLQLSWHKSSIQSESVVSGSRIWRLCLLGFEIAQCSETLDEGGHWLGPLDSASLAH